MRIIHKFGAADPKRINWQLALRHKRVSFHIIRVVLLFTPPLLYLIMDSSREAAVLLIAIRIRLLAANKKIPPRLLLSTISTPHM